MDGGLLDARELDVGGRLSPSSLRSAVRSGGVPVCRIEEVVIIPLKQKQRVSCTLAYLTGIKISKKRTITFMLSESFIRNPVVRHAIAKHTVV